MAVTISLEKYNIDGALDGSRPASNANALISIDGAAPVATLGTWNNAQGGGFVEYVLHASEEAALEDRALIILPEVADTWRVSWGRHRSAGSTTISLEKYDIDGSLSAARPASNANALISIDGAALASTLGTWNNSQGNGFVEYTLHASEAAALADRALLILPEVADTWRVSWGRLRLEAVTDPGEDLTPTPIPVPVTFDDPEYVDIGASAVDRLPEQYRSSPVQEDD